MEHYSRIIGEDEYKKAAVMICITKIGNKDFIILEKRQYNIKQGGEISFPGGKVDSSDKNFKDTAMRETIEELGVALEKIGYKGYFGSYITPIRFLIEVFISEIHLNSKEELSYNKDEVEQLLYVPVEYFIKNEPIIEEAEVYNTANFNIEDYDLPKRYVDNLIYYKTKMYFYKYEKEVIWGTTANIIFEFIKQLKETGKVMGYEYKD